MELNKKSRALIFSYLRSTPVLANDSNQSIIEHISKLEHWEQMDAEEDIDGNLVYATAWWKVTDKALEDLYKGLPPKRFNRGRNLVGFFWLIPNKDLGIMQMRRIIRRVAKMEKAKSLHIFTPRGKWFSVRLSPSRKPMDKKGSKVDEVMKIIGEKECRQQSV